MMEANKQLLICDLSEIQVTDKNQSWDQGSPSEKENAGVNGKQWVQLCSGKRKEAFERLEIIYI